MIKLLLRIGFVARRHNGTITWPFHVSPWFVIRHNILYGPRFYVFHNLPHVIKWVPGRLLPRRWGFGICGIEFGDRGH